MRPHLAGAVERREDLRRIAVLAYSLTQPTAFFAAAGKAGTAPAEERLLLSTATTLITTNDPVKIAEDYAMLQHLAGGRVDLMMGRGNTGPVYPWFGKDIRDGIDLAVPQGTVFALLGPNGAGKTTTIRMLCGLLTPDAGEGTCLGLDMRREAAAIKRQVGYMTQKFGLYDDLSIRQNLDFVVRLFELPERRQRVDEALGDRRFRQSRPAFSAKQ